MNRPPYTPADLAAVLAERRPIWAQTVREIQAAIAANQVETGKK